MIPRQARAVGVLSHLTLVIVLAAPLFHAAGYFLANQFPLFVPVTLPLSGLDRAVPLLAWTVWIYLSDYVQVLAAFLLCRQPVRFTLSFASVIVLAVTIQWVFPIEFPRALFPLEGQGISVRAVQILRQLDGPLSCFPSLHVALTAVGFLEVLRAPPARYPRLAIGAMAVWALAICVSTLTTKQHYAVDVAGGVLLALAVHALNVRGLPQRPHKRGGTGSPMQTQSSKDPVHGWGALKSPRWVWLLVLGLFALTACSAGPNPLVDQTRRALAPAGFWLGLWHGMISPITFLISLFSERVGVYDRDARRALSARRPERNSALARRLQTASVPYVHRSW